MILKLRFLLAQIGSTIEIKLAITFISMSQSTEILVSLLHTTFTYFFGLVKIDPIILLEPFAHHLNRMKHSISSYSF